MDFHERIHKNAELPRLVCQFCEYATTDQAKLTAHARIHNGEKPFACRLCDYRATRQSAVTRHFKIHMVQGPDADDDAAEAQSAEAPPTFV